MKILARIRHPVKDHRVLGAVFLKNTCFLTPFLPFLTGLSKKLSIHQISGLICQDMWGDSNRNEPELLLTRNSPALGTVTCSGAGCRVFGVRGTEGNATLSVSYHFISGRGQEA